MSERRGFIPQEILQQRDNQTCLPCCLLMWYSAQFPEKKIDFQGYEKTLYTSSFGMYREYYPLTHTATFVKAFPDVRITILVDNLAFAQNLKDMNQEDRIEIIAQKVTTPWITQELKVSPLILLTDMFYLKGGESHSPHFVYLFEGDDTKKKIVDPGFGEMRDLSDEELEASFTGLKYHMLWSPIVIKPSKVTI